MIELDATCYECDDDVFVYGYFDGYGEYELTEPNDSDDEDHHDHDLVIWGRAR